MQINLQVQCSPKILTPNLTANEEHHPCLGHFKNNLIGFNLFSCFTSLDMVRELQVVQVPKLEVNQYHVWKRTYITLYPLILDRIVHPQHIPSSTIRGHIPIELASCANTEQISLISGSWQEQLCGKGNHAHNRKQASY